MYRMHSDADGTRKVDLDAFCLSLIQLLSSNSHPNSDLATSGLSVLVDYARLLPVLESQCEVALTIMFFLF